MVNRQVERALAGAVAGIIGTAAMTVPIFLAREIGVIRQTPPKEIARNAANQTGTRQHMTHQEFSVGWLLAHLGYGAGSGLVFALARRVLPLSSPILGAVYGSILWAVSYLGVMPALGLYPLQQGAARRVVAVMLPAHWIYGAVAGEALDLLGPTIKEALG